MSLKRDRQGEPKSNDINNASWVCLVNLYPFSQHEILRLSVACHTLRQILRPFIEQSYYFRLSQELFSSLSPKRILADDIFPFPPSITHISFGEFFNKPLLFLPSSIIHLIFGRAFMSPLKLPPHLIHLEFPKDSLFNQIIEELPQSLQFLSIPWGYSQPLQLPPKLLQLVGCGRDHHTTIPSSLTHYNNAPNAPVHPMPPKVSHLVYHSALYREHEYNFCYPSLTHLTFFSPKNFHSCIYPPNLTFLNIGEVNLTCPLDNLPHSLTHLVLAGSFTVLNQLPNSITHLVIGAWLFNTPFYKQSYSFRSTATIYSDGRNVIPSSLTHFIIGVVSEWDNDRFSFFSVKSLRAPITLPRKLPATLECLLLGETWQAPLEFQHMTSLKQLSMCNMRQQLLSLSHLKLTANHLFNLYVNFPNLTHLSIDYSNYSASLNNHYTISHKMPMFLTHLTLTDPYHRTIPLHKNYNLTHVVIYFSRRSISQHSEINLTLPPSVTHLFLGASFEDHVDLPKSLKYLFIQSKKFAGTILPLPSLLYFAYRKSSGFNKTFCKEHFPFHTRIVELRKEEFEPLLRTYF